MTASSPLWRGLPAAILAAAGLLGPLGGAPARAAEAPRVASITVEGLVRVEKVNIEKALPFKVGDEWTEDLATAGVKAVYRLGPFSRVAIDAAPSGEGGSGTGGVAVTVRVTEFPLIRSVGFTGNSAVTTEILKKAVTLKAYGFFDPADYPRQVALIEKAYQAKGYHGVKVTPGSEASPAGVRVVFAIEEGKKDLVVEIDIQGNRALTDSEVKGAMSTGEAGPLSFMSDSGVLDPDVLDSDLDRIRMLYFDHGYLEVKVEAPVVRRTAGGDGLYVGIRVDEGIQFTLGKAELLGEWPSREEALPLVTIAPGEVIERERLLGIIKALEVSVRDRGYARARVTPGFSPGSGQGVMDLTLTLARGPLVAVRRIEIVGNHKTRDYVVRQEMLLQEGQLYSQKALDDSVKRIRALGFISAVEVRQVPVEGPAGETGPQEATPVDLVLTVTEGSSGTLSAGIGYSSQDGLTGTLQHSQRNLFGRGQKLNIQVDKGSNVTNYNLSFTEPRILTGDWSLGVDLFDTLKEYSQYTELRKGGGVRAGYRLGRKASLGFRYRNTRFDVLDVSADASDFIRQQAGVSVTSAVRASFDLDTRDLPMDPREGYTLEISQELAGGALGGTNSFVRTQVEGAVFTPLAGDLIGSVHLLAGAVNGYEGKAVPITERYFMGGLDSVRGFEYRKVGPLDGEGQPVGGGRTFQVNFEATYPLVKEPAIKGVLFLDGGNVWAAGETPDLGSLRWGAGVGFRWYSPMGLLRLEWGTNLDPRPQERQPGWEFTIGTSF